MNYGIEAKIFFACPVRISVTSPLQGEPPFAQIAALTFAQTGEAVEDRYQASALRCPTNPDRAGIATKCSERVNSAPENSPQEPARDQPIGPTQPLELASACPISFALIGSDVGGLLLLGCSMKSIRAEPVRKTERSSLPPRHRRDLILAQVATDAALCPQPAAKYLSAARTPPLRKPPRTRQVHSDPA
jgi:hypothetical protein